eukprot:ANDGO_02646.mRNA.1 Protein transport protein yip1
MATNKPSLDFVAVPLSQSSSSQSSSSQSSSSASSGTVASTAGYQPLATSSPSTAAIPAASTTASGSLFPNSIAASITTAFVKDRIASFWQTASATDSAQPSLASGQPGVSSSNYNGNSHIPPSVAGSAGGAEDGYFDPNKPLLEELDIDLTDISTKFKLALIPYSGWRMDDNTKLTSLIGFWGPLLAVLLFGMCLFRYALSAISWVLCVWIAGSLAVYVLIKCLGGSNYFSQVCAVLGYGTLPLVATLLVQYVLEMSVLESGVRLSTFWWTAVGCTWATATSLGMLVTEATKPRVAMLAVPILLVYLYMIRVTYLQALWNVSI